MTNQALSLSLSLSLSLCRRLWRSGGWLGWLIGVLFLPSALLGFGFALPVWGQSSNTPPDILVDDLPVAERSVSPWGSSGLGDSITFNLKDPKYVSDADPGDSRNFVCRITRSSSDSSEDLHLGIVGTDSCHRTFDTLLNPSWGSSDVFVVSVSDGTDSSMADLTIFQNSPPKVVGNDIESRGLVNRSEAFSVDVSTFFSDQDVSRTSDVLSFGLGKVKAPEGVDVDLVGSMLTASAPSEAAIYDIVVCATDTIMAQVCDSLVLDWSFNLPPVVVAGEVSQSRLTLHPGGSLMLDLGSSDFVRNTEEEDPLSCEVSRAMSDSAENVAFSLSGCSVTFRPGDVGLGSDMFTLTVTDSAGGSDSADFVVVYSDPPPTAPEVRIGRVSPRRLIFPQGGSLVLDLSHSDFVVDPNNDDVLSCRLSRAGSDTTVNVSFALSGCSVTFSAGPDGSGADVLSLEVDDGTGRSDSGTFTVYQNTPPNILIDDLPVEDRSISGARIKSFDLTRSHFVSDPNRFQDRSCNISRVDAEFFHLGFQLDDCTVIFTRLTFRNPHPELEGVVVIQSSPVGCDEYSLTVSDGMDSSTVVLTMCHNTPPQVVVGSFDDVEEREIGDGAFSEDMSTYFSEVDSGDSLRYVVDSKIPPGITASISGNTLRVGEPANPEFHTVRVCAYDIRGAKDCGSLVINWGANNPPEILIGERPQAELAVAPGESLIVDFSGADTGFVRDLDEDDLECTLTRTSGDSVMNVSYTIDGCVVTFVGGSVGWGPDEFELEVNDRNGGTDMATFTVYQNTPPDIRFDDLPAEDRSIPFVQDHIGFQAISISTRTFDLKEPRYIFDPDFNHQTLECIISRASSDTTPNLHLTGNQLFGAPLAGCVASLISTVDSVNSVLTGRWGRDLFRLSVSDGINTTVEEVEFWQNSVPRIVARAFDPVEVFISDRSYMLDLSTLFTDSDITDYEDSLRFVLGEITPSALAVMRNGDMVTVNAPESPGTYMVPVCAYDSAEAKTCASKEVRWIVNTPPVISIDPDTQHERVVAPGGSLRLDLAGSISDPDRDNHSCTVSRASSDTTVNVTFAANGCVITFEPGVAGWGADVFELLVDDGSGGTAEATFTVWQNRAPVVNTDTSASFSRKFSAGAFLADLTDHITDPDTGDTLTYTLGTLNPATLTAAISGDMLRVTVPDDVAMHMVEVCAEDDATQTDCRTLTIDWVANSPPQIDIGLITPAVPIVSSDSSSGLTVDLSPAVSDPDTEDTLTCTIARVVSDTTHNTDFTTNGCTAIFTPGSAGWGSDRISLSVEDGDGGTASATFVVWQNAPPEKVGNTDPEIRLSFAVPSHQIVLSGYFTDPDTAAGDTLTYTLGTLNPATLTPAISGDMLTVAAPVSAVTHTIQVCAQDQATQQICAIFTISWVSNIPPDIHIEQKPQNELTVAPDGGLTIDLSGSDIVTDPGDTLTCTLDRVGSDTTENIAFTAVGCTASFGPGNAGWGSDRFTLTITDRFEASDTATFTVWQNTPPQLSEQSIPTIQRKYQTGDHHEDLTSYFTDSDPEDTLAYTLGTLNPSTLTPTINGSTLTAIAPNAAAIHTIQICAQDQATQEVCAAFTISWISNQPPSLVQGTADQPLQIPLNIGETRQIFITDHYQDTDSPDTDLTWTLTTITGTTNEAVATVEVDPSNTAQINIQALSAGTTQYQLAANDTIGTTPNRQLIVTVTQPTTQPTTNPGNGNGNSGTIPNTQPTTQPTTGGGGSSFIPSTPPGPNPGVGPAAGPVTEPSGTTSTFTDTSGNTHQDNIDQLAEQGISRGCNPPTNTRYCPDRPVTRAEMATFLVRAFTLTSTQSGEFDDTGGNTHQTNIGILAANQITSGCNPPTNDRYCPDRPVTRAQMGTFLARALQLPAGSGGFTDTTDSVHRDDINRIAAAGITRGCNPPENSRYCPDRPVTRAEMATFLTRAQNLP